MCIAARRGEACVDRGELVEGRAFFSWDDANRRATSHSSDVPDGRRRGGGLSDRLCSCY